MVNASKFSQLMVRDVIEAKPWHPISYVRQQMLKHAFSYVPILHDGVWHLIADVSVAQYLRKAGVDRNVRLATRVANVVNEDKKFLERADDADANEEIAQTLDRLGGRPLLTLILRTRARSSGILKATGIL